MNARQRMQTIIFGTSLALNSILITPVFAADPFGTVTNPLPGGSLGPGGGLVTLLNNLLRLIFVLAGIFALFRIINGGLGFMNAGGDTKKITEAWSSIWQSLFGLLIVISSLVIAAIAGLLLFGDAGAILNPKIYGPK